MKIDKKTHSLKSGKGNQEQEPSRSPRDPRDRGDPRGSRAPRKEKIRRTDIEESGDKRRPFKR